MIQQCWKCRDALFSLPTNSSICYEGSRLRNTDLKLKCESIALLTSVSAFYNPSIRLLCVSCLKLLLWKFCPTLYQMCLHVTNIRTKVTCMMGKTLFQCNRKIHSAKLDDIYGMLSVIKSAAVAWDLCHGSHRHTWDFSPGIVKHDVLIFLTWNISYFLLWDASPSDHGCFSTSSIRLSHWDPPPLPRILLPQTRRNSPGTSPQK